MRYKNHLLVMLALITVIVLTQCTREQVSNSEMEESKAERDNNPALIAEGKNIFRFDTFGDEDFWSGLLHLNKAVAGADNGGYGPGVSPVTALSVGLKVDAEALPQAVVTAISNGSIDLNDPATTLELLKLNAVVGLKGTFDGSGN